MALRPGARALLEFGAAGTGFSAHHVIRAAVGPNIGVLLRTGFVLTIQRLWLGTETCKVKPQASMEASVGGMSSFPGVRQAGVLFLILGAAGFSAYFIPGGPAYHHGTILVANLIVLAAGGLLRTRLASRLTGYWSLVIPALGLAVCATCDANGLLTPVALGVYFIAVFLWIGLWHPPGTAIRFTPVALAAYLLPRLADPSNQRGTAASVVLVIGVCIVVAEVVSRQVRTARHAQAEQAEALEALAEASRTDDLTGLGNRRLGNRLLECLTGRDAIVILDVDHFKAINDRWGHSRGDQLLQELGAFLTREVPLSETVARMGGEEFMLVIRDTTASQARDVAGELVARWRSSLPLATISAGVALHRQGASPSHTYAEADAALYQAKTSGRDQVAEALST
jgi:diguanylate cyclase (GGDEF)-like protein